MRVLLDTHVFIWWCNNETGRLPAAWLSALSGVETEVFVSAVTATEIAIKRKLGKLTFPTDVPAVIRQCRFVELAITAAHGELSGDLPMIHRDPFDRLLIAQARIEGMQLATLDGYVRQYQVGLL